MALPRPDADPRIQAAVLLRELGGGRGARLREARRAARARASRLRSPARPARGPHGLATRAWRTWPPSTSRRSWPSSPLGRITSEAFPAGPSWRFEMAQQLRAAGHDVGALVLLEPPRLGHRNGRPDAAIDPGSLRNTGGLVRKVRVYWAKWQLWDGRERVADLRRQAARLRRRPRGPAGSPGAAGSAEEALRGADVLPEDVLNHVEPYVPRAYPGRATLVLARHERFRRERLERVAGPRHRRTRGPRRSRDPRGHRPGAVRAGPGPRRSRRALAAGGQPET